MQKQTKSGDPGTKSRKYTCFEQMRFSNTSNTRSRHLFELFTNDPDKRREDEGSNDGKADTYTCRNRERNISRKINYEQQLLDIVEKSEQNDKT